RVRLWLVTFVLPNDLHSFPTRRSSDLIIKQLTRHFRRAGIKSNLGVFFEKVEETADGVKVTLADGKEFEAEICLTICQCDLHARSEEHTSELQSRFDLVCRLLLEKRNI